MTDRTNTKWTMEQLLKLYEQCNDEKLAAAIYLVYSKARRIVDGEGT